MADKPTGPLKPPTLDLTARKSEDKDGTAAKPAAPKPDQVSSAAPKPAATAQTNPKPAAEAAKKESAAKPDAAPTPVKPNDRPLPLAALAATGLGGAAVGLAAAYGLAIAGYWPQSGQTIANDQIAALETRIARSETALEQTSANLETLGSRLGTIEAAPAPEIPALPHDIVTSDALTPLQNRIDELALRLDASDAGLPAEESAALAQEISRLGAGLADLEATISAPDTTQESLVADLESLTARIGTLEAQAATQEDVDAARAERDRFARLPAATAALEAAIGAGTPFGSELAAIETLVPELGLSNPIRTIAANGVAPMREITSDYRALIPALLAARPQAPEAGWLDTVLGQAQSALALRPVDDDGETPEALVGRIETALESGDASGARALLLDLPETMQQVASPIRSKLDTVIAARALVDDIRALAPGTQERAQ